MANGVTAKDVTVLSSWSEGGTNGKRRVGLLCRIEDTGTNVVAGGNTNTIPASAFGLSKIESSGNLLVYTTSSGASVSIYETAPSYNGALLNTRVFGAQAVADVTITTGQRGLIEIRGQR